MAISFAPLTTPLYRRMQTFAVVWHVFSIPSVLSIFLLFCSFPPAWPLVIAYICYYFFDDSPDNGAAVTMASTYFKQSMLWRYFADYFPLTVHKTVELDPTWINDVTADTSASGNLDSDSEDTTISTTTADAEQKHSTRIIQSSSEFNTDTQTSALGLRIQVKNLFLWLISFIPFARKPEQKLRRVGRQYIFGYHPHGIISMGAIGGIATDGCHWSKMFPGIPVSTLTLVAQFQLPFYREYLLSLGLASVSKRSCAALLKRGQSICIVLGGAQESLLARPGNLELVLNKRKGFVKLAMQVGNTSLVPVMAFGENDIYEQVDNNPSSKLYRIQTFLKNNIGFTLPLMHARGIFNYDFGIIPYRRPINIVVGEPIEIPELSSPTEEQVNHYHKLYVDGLKQLYEDHKDKFHKDLTGDFPDCVYKELDIVA